MPKTSKWKAQHVGCQKAVDDLKAHYEAMLQKRLSFVCSGCGDDFTETIESFALQPMKEVTAPSLCYGCGHGYEDDQESGEA